MDIKSHLSSIKHHINSNLVIRGTLILTIVGFSTRIIGFYNRIFLSGLIGATQLGVYQLILPVYMIAFALTTYGSELALTKLVSEHYSRKEFTYVKTLFRICFTQNLFLGLFTSCILFFNAEWVCTHLLNAPDCALGLKILCCAFPFMSMKGAIHGYFLGLEKSSIHGISDLLEQCAKILSVYLLASYICIRNEYDVCFALWGIVIADFVAFLYSVTALFYYQKKQKGLFSEKISSIHLRNSISIFYRNTIPLTTNRLTSTVLQSIESIMIPSVLLIYYGNSSGSLTHYGTFTGMAFPFIMFPSTITNALSTMLLPAVSSAKSTLNKNYLSKLCEKSLHFCLLIGLFSMIMFYIYGTQIGTLFFQNKEAGNYLYQLSFLCPLIYLATTLASILNGLGYAIHNLFMTAFATLIRIAFIYFLVPHIGMTGYIIGLFVGYLFLTFVSLHMVQKHIVFRLYFLESIFLPFCTFTIVGAFIYYLYHRVLSGIHPVNFETLLLLITCIIGTGLVSIPPFLNLFQKPRNS